MSARRGELRQLAHDALVGQTIAGNNVFLPRDWPTNSTTMPNISIQTPREQKMARGRSNGQPRFGTTTWLQLRCQVAGTDPGQVEDDLESLVNAAELVIMGLVILPPQRFEEIPQVEYDMTLSAEAERHFGEATLQFGFVYPERFDAVITDKLEGLNVVAANGPVVALPASEGTATGSAVLHFDGVPAEIVPGLVVFNATSGGTLQLGSEVQSVSRTTVTLTKTAIGGGVLAGDTIRFAGSLLAQQTIDLPPS